MKNSIENITKINNILKNYTGTNPYIIQIRNQVFAYQDYNLNSFQMDFVLQNYNLEPIPINKIIKVSEFWAKKKQEEWNTDFVPQKLFIGWFIGDTADLVAVSAKYRQSVPAKLMFIPKSAIITDFLSIDWRLKNIDFSKYEKKLGYNLYPHQKDAVKFLTARKKAILADTMGFGKTLSAIVASLEGGFNHVCVICPASVKETWKRELSAVVDEKNVTIVNGSKWDDARYTIINYDILNNFYKVPTQSVKKKELNVDENGNIFSEFKDKIIVSRNKSVINNAMDNSQLFQSHFDLIIIDEAHKLANSTSGRFKIVSDFVKRSNPQGIFELTGTPITNRPINFFNLLKIIDCPIANNWENYVMRYCDGKQFYNPKQKKVQTAIFLNRHGKKTWYDLSQDEKRQLNDLLAVKCRKIWVTTGASNLEELQEVVKPYYIRREKADLKALSKKTVKYITYNLTASEKEDYDNLWEQYVADKIDEKSLNDLEKYKKLTEITILRQWLANNMLERTYKLAMKNVNEGHKVVIFCSFDNEINTLKEKFGDICVIHNGKMTNKKKTESVDKFQNDDNIKIFIGNIVSAGVGLTLIAGSVAIFNSYSFVPGDNLQCEDRIHRLGQEKDCTIYYQMFANTFYEKMIDMLSGKESNIKSIIIREKEK